MIPIDAVSETFVFSFQIETIQIWVMTGAIPPSAFKSGCAIISPRVIVIVQRAKFCPFFGETLSEFSVNAGVDYSEFKKLSSNNEIVHNNLCFVSKPIFHFYQKLLGRAEGDIVPEFETNPMILLRISKSLFIRIPLSQKIILFCSKIASSL